MSKPHFGSSSRTGTTSGSAGKQQQIRSTRFYANRLRLTDVQKVTCALRMHKSSRALAADPASSSGAASARLLPALPVLLALPRWTRNTRRLACDSRKQGAADAGHAPGPADGISIETVPGNDVSTS